MSVDRRKTATQRGYDGKWQKARRDWLQQHPLCAEHQKLGRIVPATVVDHIVPHKGDMSLFWDRKNWQSLCKPCHDSHKQRIERGGPVVGCDLTGLPIDPGHHWHRGGGG